MNKYGSRKFLLSVIVFCVVEAVGAVFVFAGHLQGADWLELNKLLAPLMQGLYLAGNLVEKRYEPKGEQ